MLEQEKSLYQKVIEAGTHTIIYGLGSVLQSVMGFILIPLYTHYYTTDMYGALSMINLCGSLAGNIFYFGASSALARSYYDYSDVDERKKVVSTSFYIALFGAFLQVSVGFLFLGPISQLVFHSNRYKIHIMIVFISSALAFINALFYILLRFERKSKHVVALNILTLILTSSLITFLLVYMKAGIMAPILGGLIAQLVLFAFLIYLLRDLIVLDYSPHELRIQLPFGFQVVLSGLGYYLLDWLNRFFINKYGSLGDVGIYSLGSQIGGVINILFIASFGQIWAPMRMQYRNDKNADDFYKKMLTYYAVIGLSVTVVISLFSRELIVLAGGHKEYIGACRVVPFVMVGLLIYGTVGLIDHGIYFARKLIYLTYIFWFAAGAAFVLNYVFVRRYGYMAAAASIASCYALIAMLVFHVSNKLYKIPYEGRRLALISGISFLTLVSGYVVHFSNIFSGIIFKGGMISIMIAAIFFYVLTESEKLKITGLLKEIIL